MGGTYGPVSRIRSARSDSAHRREEVVIYLGRPSPALSSGLPAPRPDQHRGVGGQPPCRRRSAHGATWPFTPWGLPGRIRHRTRRCALTAPFHPLPRRRPGVGPAIGVGLLSVARAIRTAPRAQFGLCGRRCSLPVRKHGALRCSDFPHRRFRARRCRAPTNAGRSTERQPDPHVNGVTPCRRPGFGGRRGKEARRRKSAEAGGPSARIRSRPFLSSRRSSRCRDLRRR